MTQAVPSRPEFGRLYGITYDQNTRVAIIRAPRVLKVGIGIPKGRAIHVFIHGGIWHVRFGKWEETGGKKKLVMKTVYRGGSVVNNVTLSNERTDVETWFNAHKSEAAVSNRPQKIPHFTFTRRTIFEDESGKPAEVFEPDWEAIEAHGDAPRRIPVILTTETPLYQELAWWTASELKCHGDGLIAERSISAGVPEDPGWKEAKDAGLKSFVFTECATAGCPHYGVDCKPHSTLNLQLAYAMRLGATAYFTTTGTVSAGQLFSSITEIREAVETRGYSIAGIPMDLVLGSFKANFEGKPSIQPCVSLELRSQGNKKLNEILAENSWVPAQLGASAKLLEATQEEVATFDSQELLAPAINAEFSDADFDEEAPAENPPPPAAAATQAKQSTLAEKLKAQSQTVATTTTAALPSTPANFPWSDRTGMNHMFGVQKERIGEAAFNAVFTKHRVMGGTLRADDPVALKVLTDLMAHAVGTAAAAPATEDMF